MTNDRQVNVNLFEIALKQTMSQGYRLHHAYLKECDKIKTKEGQQELEMAFHKLKS